MTPYLIQRAKFENKSHKKGIDSILSFDYMGSAEFEFGALGESLERVRNKIGEYTYLDVPVGEKVITVFCNNENKAEIKTYLQALVDKTCRTKEFTAFDSYIKDDGYFKDRFDMWWDIKNDVMFWKKNAEFEKKFKPIIEKKPE